MGQPLGRGHNQIHLQGNETASHSRALHSLFAAHHMPESWLWAQSDPPTRESNYLIQQKQLLIEQSLKSKVRLNLLPT